MSDYRRSANCKVDNRMPAISLFRKSRHTQPTASPRVLVIVAHPDDEILWVGGMILMHPKWNWRIVSLCRGSDADRAPRFMTALERLGSSGFIMDLDDGPEQFPLSDDLVHRSILKAVEGTNYDVLITHNLYGEYTRHIRHEEIGRAAMALWQKEELKIGEMWMFAYSDSNKTHIPTAIETADIVVQLPHDIWNEKCSLLREVYQFTADSFEMQTSPKTEAFWCFEDAARFSDWHQRQSAVRHCLSVDSE